MAAEVVLAVKAAATAQVGAARVEEGSTAVVPMVAADRAMVAEAAWALVRAEVGMAVASVVA